MQNPGEEKKRKGEVGQEEKEQSEKKQKIVPNQIIQNPIDPACDIQQLLFDAGNNIIDAQVLLAYNYINGFQTFKSKEEGAKYLNQVLDSSIVKESKGKHPVVLWAQGMKYEAGIDCEKNLELAFSCYQKAASNNNYSPAQDSLGLCYFYGRGVEQNDKNAVYYFDSAAKQGYARAITNLGICYLNGRGVTRNVQEAIRLFEDAKQRGDVRAKYYLSTTYTDILSQNSNITGNEELVSKAYEDLWEAADIGFVDAQLKLGIHFYNEFLKDKNVKHAEQAMSWLERAANQENDIAQCYLGKCFYYGRITKQDYTIAFELFQLSAAQGNIEAKIYLVECYFYGNGIEKNPENDKKAVKLLESLLEENDNKEVKLPQPVIPFVMEDNKKAGELLQPSLKENIPRIKNLLGMFYLNGRGVNKDEIKAQELFSRAAKESSRQKQCDGVVRAKDPDVQYGLVMILLNEEKIKQKAAQKSMSKDPIGQENDSDNKYKLAMSNLKCGTEEMKSEAISLLYHASGGNVDAKFMLGFCHFNGIGLPGGKSEAHIKTAVEFFITATQGGHIDAPSYLGECCLNGIGGLPKDLIAAERLFIIGKEEGSIEAEYNLGKYYLENKVQGHDVAEAMEFIEHAVNKGNDKAQLYLGKCYLMGTNGKAIDHAKAVELFELAEKQNNAEAQYYLAICYRDGLGGMQQNRTNEQKAVNLFEKVAEGEHGYADKYYVNAICSLGVCYRDGIGVKKDEKEALNLFMEAGNRGSQLAKFYAAICYCDGVGVEQSDLLASNTWLRHILLDDDKFKDNMQLSGVVLDSERVNLKHDADLRAEVQYRIAKSLLSSDCGLVVYQDEAETLLKEASAKGNSDAKKALEEFLKLKKERCDKEIKPSINLAAPQPKPDSTSSLFFQPPPRLTRSRKKSSLSVPPVAEQDPDKPDKEDNQNNYFKKH